MYLISAILVAFGAALLELQANRVDQLNYDLHIIGLVLVSLGATVAVLELL